MRKQERLAEAARAVELARGALKDAEQRGPEVTALKTKLAAMRAQNHFAIGLENMIKAGYEGGGRHGGG